uniref:Myb-like protein J n=1 Tax=Cajanus cajan TaxID=3821 RepID=A0A151SUX2_CAJCA|nr:Myb-like protein J [Cajanus cajan]
MDRLVQKEKDNSAAVNIVEKKKHDRWTREEHWLFLKGVQKYGRGNWKNIARHVVKTRSSSQVASHAQKHYQRQEIVKQNKRKRSSIHDITLHSHLLSLEQFPNPIPQIKKMLHSPSHHNSTDQPNPIQQLPCHYQLPLFIDQHYTRVQHHLDQHMLQELEQELNPPHNISAYEMRGFKNCDFM